MSLIQFIRQVFSAFSKDKAGQMSAAFAYVAVFSVGPLLLVLVSIVGFVYGQEAANGQLYGRLADTVGPDTAKSLQSAIAHIHQAGSGVIALIFGAVGLLLGGVGLTSQLQNSFNTILDAVPDPKGGIKRTIYTKLKNMVIIILAAAVIVASVVVSALINGAGKALGLEFLNTLASLALFVAIMYLIYRFLPDVVIPSKVVLVAAAWVSLLFLVGKIILGIIIGRNATASAYGAAASLVVLLLWFYYTAQILLMGAEGIKLYGANHGLDYPAKRYTLKRRTIDIDIKKDLRGRILEGFIRGYKSKKRVK